MKKWLIGAGAGVALLLAGLVVLWASGVFKVKAQDGTIVVENLPADAEVFVDGEKVALKLTGDGKLIEIQVAPGKRKLEIKTAGFKIETQKMTLAAGERRPIGIRLEPLAAASEKPAADPDEITNTISMKLKLIKPGTFTMGSPKDEEDRDDNEGPQHEVEITKGFYMAVYAVTKGQFAAFVSGTDYKTVAETAKEAKTWRDPGFDSYNQTDNDPVVYVSWNDAEKFCEWLSKKGKRTYEMPTEAQWEYACRAGTTTAFSFQDPEELKDYAWHVGRSGNHTHPVGEKKPNPWGLYDMHGNVWQWCADGYGPYDEKGIIDPKGKEGEYIRVFRGGSFYCVRPNCRSARRWSLDPPNRDRGLGFRVASPVSASQRPQQVGDVSGAVPPEKPSPPDTTKPDAPQKE